MRYTYIIAPVFRTPGCQRDSTEHLAHLHHFSMTKMQNGEDIEFRIIVREYVTPIDPSMPFFAIADKQTNQRTAPYTPSGWSSMSLRQKGAKRSPDARGRSSFASSCGRRK